MSAISRWLDRFCYRHPNFGIAGLMRYIAIGNVFVYLLDRVSRGTFTHIIAFYPSMILKGQIWRLLSFVFVPQSTTLIWFVLSVMMYYYLGTALERHWGKARFSMFYLVGVVMNIIIGFALYFYLGRPQTAITANMTYVNMSIFFPSNIGASWRRVSRVNRSKSRSTRVSQARTLKMNTSSAFSSRMA